jgi:hypothetical protein
MPCGNRTKQGLTRPQVDTFELVTTQLERFYADLQ